MKIGKKIIVLTVLVFMFFPIFTYAVSWWPLVPCGTSVNPTPCNQCDLFRLLKNVIDFVLIGLMPPVAAILFVWGGFLILMGGANPGLISKGRSIFWNTAIGVAIILASWLITNTIIRSIAEDNIAPEWWKFECRVTTVSQPPVPQPSEGPLPSGACNQSFSLVSSSGCSGTACVDASNITPTHGCESHDGVCLLSQEASEQAKKFIASFNSLSGGKCTLRLSSTIQGGSGPSISQCHKPGTSKSGTCADFNLLPDHNSCSQYFYQAARSSGAVVSFLDEYVAACKPNNATGGNIHVNF
ncbi:MAG: hypothetical protein A2915_04265 [Candidatus Yanofskybacteria bacterium RIFCSPLOWO2_01_FULL_41_34]|uniref:Uncharacterized protein n=1 Tax=Candidatus Yanofskybacteria bacterium RIFCSPHIGHO2_01_FULL_41_26 TaxID=1802661 RepID=A0A1F8EDA2_9BACT|nr:MAG: hypothetical protein A2649_03365 [Candidatus Yanofskybacteria bacterium RIFCSPHIGHO2_01_FULL_41_26]OGN21619.1 MAG: hypothetical protein A2915_04265 [Candidatus Yanofskybacteria bacterium RIFCSPLOWO2_01_FULL_41_34]